MSVGEVILELKDAERNLWVDVPLKGDLREMVDILRINLNAYPILVFSIDRDGVTAQLALSNKHQDIVKGMLREGRQPPIPLIQVRFWVSSSASAPTDDPNLNAFVTYQNTSPMPADAEANFIKVMMMVFFAALTNLAPTLIAHLASNSGGFQRPVA
jgi:hypothetical protein